MKYRILVTSRIYIQEIRQLVVAATLIRWEINELGSIPKSPIYFKYIDIKNFIK